VLKRYLYPSPTESFEVPSLLAEESAKESDSSEGENSEGEGDSSDNSDEEEGSSHKERDSKVPLSDIEKKVIRLCEKLLIWDRKERSK
jgi:hypothetical protein